MRWGGNERSARGATPSEGPQGPTLREFREADAWGGTWRGGCNEAEGMSVSSNEAEGVSVSSNEARGSKRFEQ